MARHDPPNPYRELTLGALGDALMARAGDLMEGRRVGRLDTAYLLISAGHVVRPEVGAPGLPRARFRTGEAGLLESFRGQLQNEQRAIRYRIAQLALDAADWPLHERGRLTALAAESDDGFAAALGEVDAALGNEGEQ